MSLTHWYPLVEDLADKITGEKLTGSFTMSNKGKIGNNLDTNTVHESSFIMNNSWNPITSSISMACWVKFDYAKIKEFFSTKTSSYDTPAGNIVGNHSYAGLGLIWSGNSLKNFTTMKVFAHIRGTGANTGTSSYTIPDNTWTHIALTADYETKTLKFYLNGEYKSSTSYSSLTDTGSGATRKLMLNYSGVYGGNGPGLNIPMSLNDVRIYDHTLSQAEVKELSKALVVHYSFNDRLAEPTTNLITSPHNIKYVSGASDNNVSAAGLINAATTTSGTYTLSGEYNIAASDSATGPRITMLVKYEGESNWSSLGRAEVIRDGTWRTFTLTGTTNPSKTVTCCGAWLFDYSSAGSARSCYARNLQFELKDHATPYTPTSRDSVVVNETGYGGNGTLYNSNLSTDTASGILSCHTPRVNPANTNGNVTTTNSAFVYADVFGYNHTPTEFTVAWWWKVMDWGHGTGPFGLVTSNGNYMESTLGVHDGAVYVNFTGGQTRMSRIFSSGGTGKWTHFALTFKPGSYACYINGVRQKYETEPDPSLTLDPWRYLYLGAGCAGGVLRDGDIYWGDFRYYNTCLSANDITELYKTKAYVTDKGDIMCGEFIENKTEAEVTEKSIFECNEIQEKLNIPGFELLDGILIEKNPYFNTGLVFSDVNTSIYVDAEVTPTNTSGNNCLAGSGNSDWNGPIMLNFCGGKMEFGTSGYSTSTEPQGKFAANERLTVQAEIYPTTQKWYKNNVQINNITQRDRKTTNATFAIGTFKTSSSTVGATHSFKGYIHRFYIKYGDEIRCYLPAKRKSDNVYGLYDIHTKTFLVNSGGGTVSGTTSILCDEAAIYEDGHIGGREIIEL